MVEGKSPCFTPLSMELGFENELLTGAFMSRWSCVISSIVF